jgi:hypothetical protein
MYKVREELDGRGQRLCHLGLSLLLRRDAGLAAEIFENPDVFVDVRVIVGVNVIHVGPS